ncbi:unnamed protein product [Anisakis simplex]|uniref:Uncharacterized protein n=1 Tax=Anisakis simplex TaxID=6269 RepID=A0A0M3JP14_ANISI|nr:unnamed protein product [Anisakis simplex]
MSSDIRALSLELVWVSQWGSGRSSRGCSWRLDRIRRKHGDGVSGCRKEVICYVM